MSAHTRLARGRPPAEGHPYGATAPPIVQTATFRQSDAQADGPYDYSRSGNPTREQFEREVAALEGAAHGLAFASGMAALAAVTQLAGPGDEIVAGDDLYGGLHRLLHEVTARAGVVVRHVDTTDVAAVRAACTRRTRLVLLETPTNPRMRITDVAAIADVAHAVGALVVVDNTMLSPLLQRPLALGADLVVHSATKHLGGHGDVTGGVVVTSNDAVAERLGFLQNATGSALAPFEAWLLLRGLRTLGVRLERAQATAAILADALRDEPGVTAVWYPGLSDHPGARLHAAQADGPGSVVAFETGDRARSEAFIDALRDIGIAVSFGGVATTVCLPCRMSHASIPAAVRRERALPDDLVRLSVGLEDPDDLLREVRGGLAAARRAGVRITVPATCAPGSPGSP